MPVISKLIGLISLLVKTLKTNAEFKSTSSFSDKLLFRTVTEHVRFVIELVNVLIKTMI